MKTHHSRTAVGATMGPFRRSRLFIGALLVLGAVAAIVSIISARTVRRRWHDTEEALQATAEDRTMACDALERILYALMHQRARDTDPVPMETQVALADLTTTLARFVEHRANDPSLRVDRMRVYRLLGQAYRQNNQVDSAESAYRKARELLLELLDAEPNPEYGYLLAENGHQLSRLLAELGRPQEAEQLSLGAMQELRKLVGHYPERSQYASELAIAYNNLGLLSLKLGREEDAERYLRQSISMVTRLRDQFPNDFRHPKRLIDTQQILVGLLWSSGRLEEAREVSIQSLSAIRQYRESSAGTLELEIARNMALENDASIEKELATSPERTEGRPKPREASGSTHPPCLDWNWRHLSPHDGKSIQPDVLATGVLPADFEQHDALLLGFTWALDDVWHRVLLDIVFATWEHVQLVILVPDELAQALLVERLQHVDVPVDRIQFHQLPTDTVWVRDYGPLSVRTGRGGYRWVDAHNASALRPRDDCVPEALGRLMQTSTVRASIALEGGNLLSNGQGLCLTTRYLLEQNRAFGYSDDHVKETLQRLFGAREIVYLEPLVGEKTGHVDIFAAFTAPDTVVVGDYTGEDPVNAAVLDRNAERLRRVITASGPLKVVRIPMPPRGTGYFGGTYTNVLFANRVLIVPTWPESSCEVEEQVMATYRRLLPDWNVIAIDAGDLVSQDGALRCMSLPLHRVRPIGAGKSSVTVTEWAPAPPFSTGMAGTFVTRMR